MPRVPKVDQVLESVLRDDGSRRRRYQCANLHRFSTVERVEEIKTGGWRHGQKRAPNGRFSTATEETPPSSTKE